MGLKETVGQISLSRLFLVTVVGKVVFSFLAYKLQSPWLLGFSLPLALMAIYIAIGFARQGDSRTSDESFGDSCYYLGFIFTISSIAFALFDVPDLDQAGKLTEVAVRFGAAMVSTFAGIIVRIYLTGFRRDAGQALDQLEDRVIEAADLLRTRMDISADNFRSFDRTIHEHTKDSVTRFTMLHEELGKTLAAEFSSALADTAKGAKEVYGLAAKEMAATADDISAQLRGWSQALLDDLRLREAETERFLNDIRSRLDRMTLPEDFFASRLQGPANGMADAVKELRARIDEFATSVSQGAQQTSLALEEVRTNVKASNTALDGAKKRSETLVELTNRLAEAGHSMAAAAGLVQDQRQLVEALVRDISVDRKSDEQTRASFSSAAEQVKAAAKALADAAAALQVRVVRQEAASAVAHGAPSSPASTAVAVPHPSASSAVVHGSNPATPQPARTEMAPAKDAPSKSFWPWR